MDIHEILNHFEISENDIERLSVINSAEIERIGVIIAFNLSKGKGRAVINYDPAYPFAVIRIYSD